MKKIFALLVFSTVLFTSCGGSGVDLAIDNPTKFSVEVMVDTLRVVVPPKEVVWVEMGKGEHMITLENDSIINYNFTEPLYMINPSLTEYLAYEEYYGPELYQNSFMGSMPNKTVTFLGIEFEGNYEVINNVINKVTWDYGPREKLPEMVEVDADEMYTSLVKLYDPREFIDLIQAEAANYEE